ncbi:MAG: phosphoribosylamine--glycine ligase [Candidatus Wallbacteria bacterium]|nr:phosphoribosylamine--glycine ligase [Candidatus Wallbacteria bacterium]
MKILIIGNGAREHALAWKFAQSKKVDSIFIIPGNGGTASIGTNIEADPMDFEALHSLIATRHIDLTVVGPEIPLSEGITDFLQEKGVKVFGPTRHGALVESSKSFSKGLMKKHGIPTADFTVFTDLTSALSHVRNQQFPLVIKADGLAAGKGVFICDTYETAEKALTDMLAGGIFGEAGKKVLVEKFLEGREVSVLALTDGYNLLPLIPVRDYKRICDGNIGLNTGGMGAIADHSLCDQEMHEKIMSRILRPAIDALRAEGINYRGVLYAGVLISNGEPYTLEFNCRFGDPETQVIMPLIENDLIDLMMGTLHSNLDKINITWRKGVALSVVAVSRGYPENFQKGQPITGLDTLSPDVLAFHGGTTLKNGELTVSGGRVINLVTVGESVEACRQKIYEEYKKVEFEKIFFRKDIGL